MDLTRHPSTRSYGLCDVHVGFPIFGRWPTTTSLSTVTERLRVVTSITVLLRLRRGEIRTKRQPHCNTHPFTRRSLPNSFDEVVVSTERAISVVRRFRRFEIHNHNFAGRLD